MLRSPSRSILVSHLSGMSEARRLAKAMAIEIGFDIQESEEIAIVVSELASNLVKHAQSGHLTLTTLEDGGRPGIKIETQDAGPGIPDIDQAITDGFSTAGSLGHGLGSINRLMDEFEIRTSTSGNTGTYITCLKRRREHIPKAGVCPLSFGVATRAYHNMELNGDAFMVRQGNGFTLTALIDGLGHGQFANRAALTARQYIVNHIEQPLEAIFRGVGRACLATRGVVLALVRFDWATETIKLTFASVGNIEARAFGSLAPKNFRVLRGVIGLNAPKPVVTEHCWDPDWVLVLFSDGLQSNWRWNDFPELAEAPAPHAARRLLQALTKDNDDTTVIVVRKRCMQEGDSL